MTYIVPPSAVVTAIAALTSAGDRAPTPQVAPQVEVTAPTSQLAGASDAAPPTPTSTDAAAQKRAVGGDLADEKSKCDAAAATPALALRTFLVAMLLKDEATLRAVTLPTDDFAWLLRGEVPADKIEEARTRITQQPIRVLRPGDEIPLLHGHKATISPTAVTDDRALVLPEGAPAPFARQKVDGRWRVDAGPLIASRKAADAARSRPSDSPLAQTPETPIRALFTTAGDRFTEAVRSAATVQEYATALDRYSDAIDAFIAYCDQVGSADEAALREEMRRVEPEAARRAVGAQVAMIRCERLAHAFRADEVASRSWNRLLESRTRLAGRVAPFTGGTEGRVAPIDAEAVARARVQLRMEWTQCGGSWYQEVYSDGQHFIEIKGPLLWQVAAAPISDADRMNGVEWLGTVTATGVARRTTESEAGGGKRKWSNWSDDDRVLSGQVKKMSGKWTFSRFSGWGVRVDANDVASAPDCDKIASAVESPQGEGAATTKPQPR